MLAQRAVMLCECFNKRSAIKPSYQTYLIPALGCFAEILRPYPTARARYQNECKVKC